MAKKDYQSWSKEDLIREIWKLEKRKKYGIVWEDKPEKVDVNFGVRQSGFLVEFFITT